MKGGKNEGRKEGRKKKKEKGSTEEWKEKKIEGNGWMQGQEKTDNKIK